MLKKLLAYTCLTLSLSANADLIDNGTFITDDRTATDYLKLSQTAGYSWNQVVDQDVLGYITGGWTVTSQTVLRDVIFEEDISVAYKSINDINPNDPNGIRVATNSDFGSGQTGLPEFVIWDFWSPTQYGPNLSAASADRTDLYVVSLSRASVPIPAAAWLFGSALLGLGMVMRRKA